MTHPTKAIYKILLHDAVKVCTIRPPYPWRPNDRGRRPLFGFGQVGHGDSRLWDEKDMLTSMDRIELINYHQASQGELGAADTHSLAHLSPTPRRRWSTRACVFGATTPGTFSVGRFARPFAPARPMPIFSAHCSRTPVPRWSSSLHSRLLSFAQPRSGDVYGGDCGRAGAVHGRLLQRRGQT